MNLREFVKLVFLLAVLVLVSTGLSLFDKESSYYRQTQKSDTPPQKASLVPILPTSKTETIKNAEEGGGVAEEDSPFITESFVDPEINPDFLPIRNWSVPDPEINARGALVFYPDRGKNLYAKNIESPLPPASITKLVTALTVLDYLDPDEIITVSKQAVATEGAAGNLVVGEEISVKNLLAAMLIESSNDAAVALEEYVNTIFAPKTLRDEMNRKAQILGLTNTRFKTVHGLDLPEGPSNYAASSDIARLLSAGLENTLIKNYISTKELDVLSQNGFHNHRLTNSNGLLGIDPRMLGGKTGYTDLSGESMASFVTAPRDNGYLIIVVLNTADRENDTLTLMNWVKNAYLWN